MNRIRRTSLFALATLFAATTMACGERFEENTTTDEQPEANSDDLTRVGDGIPSTGEQRSALLYGDEDGCTEGTELELVPEEGGSTQTVCGVKAEDNGNNPIVVYKGIPYAAPPIGDLRWRDPEPSELKEVRAVEYGPSCLQAQKDRTYDPTQVSEDCLYLNVWSPNEAATGKKKVPVLVFIHGGAFLTGSGGEAKGDISGNLNLYDGRQFLTTARKNEEDVVFVTLNYRLGALGFLAGDEYGLDGNYGIKDQTKALEWVKRNIARFGGDPEQVTIFGESAGAQSVALHLTIQENDHQSLFGQAVVQSDYTMGYMSLNEAQKRANDFSGKLGCASESDPVTCLRSAQASAILEAGIPAALSAKLLACEGWNAALPWNPVIDGHLITDEPIHLPISKPLIVGSNLSEGDGFTAPLGEREGTLAYQPLLRFLFGTVKAREIDDLYSEKYPSLNDYGKLTQTLSDYTFTCFARALARHAAKSGSKVYRYFDRYHPSHTVYGSDNDIANVCSVAPRVCHADELPFVFGNPSSGGKKFSFLEDELIFSETLQRHWLSLATRSDPNPTRAPLLADWEEFGKSENLLDLTAPSDTIAQASATSVDDEAFCDYWDTYGYAPETRKSVCDE